MKFLMRLFSVAMIGAVVLVLGLAANAEDFKRSKLTVAGSEFSVELALTPQERQRGLMFRRSLAADHGMLFDFDQMQPITMWMKNTFIPLDMVFIDVSGTIIHISERTVPQSLEVISSQGPARYVLEVNGGTADRLGWTPGDTVTGLPR